MKKNRKQAIRAIRLYILSDNEKHDTVEVAFHRGKRNSKSEKVHIYTISNTSDILYTLQNLMPYNDEFRTLCNFFAFPSVSYNRKES